MARTMPKITPQETGDIFIGSGALQYPWWSVAAMRGIDHPRNADDWAVELCELDEESRRRARTTAGRSARSTDLARRKTRRASRFRAA